MIKYVLIPIIFLFISCGNYQEKVIVEKTKLTILEPPVNHFTYIEVPYLSEDILEDDIKTVENKKTEYIITLQSIIKKYETRVDSLINWLSTMKDIKTKIETKKEYEK